MKRRILVVGNSHDHLRMATWVLEPQGDAVICATLAKEKATDEFPYVGDILRQCEEKQTALDALLLYDPSHPKGHDGHRLPFESWQKASRKLETLEADMEPLRPVFEVTTDDPVGVSARQEELQRDLDAMHKQQVDEARAILTKGKEAAEDILFRNPPSDNGIKLIHSLRAGNSAYRDIPIAVSMAFPDREKALREAGANIVQTSATLDADPYALVTSAIAQQQLEGRWAEGSGPQSPLDQARRPRPPRDTER